MDFFADYDFDRKRVLTRIPYGDFIGVTGGEEGKRFYIKVKNDDTMDRLVSVMNKNIIYSMSKL